MNETVREYFDEVKFLKHLHSIPDWIKNEDDLLVYIQHLHYRMDQREAQYRYYSNNFKLSDAQHEEVSRIITAFDDSYQHKIERISLSNVENVV